MAEGGDESINYEMWSHPPLPSSPSSSLSSPIIFPSPQPTINQSSSLSSQLHLFNQTQEQQLQYLSQQMIQQQQIIEQLQISLGNTQNQFKIMWDQFSNHHHVSQSIPVQASDNNLIINNIINNNHLHHHENGNNNNITVSMGGKELNDESVIELVTNSQYILELKHVPPKSHFIVTLEPLPGCIFL